MKLTGIIATGVTSLALGVSYAQVQDAPAVSATQIPDNMDWARNFTLTDPETVNPASGMTLQENSRAFQFGGEGRWTMNVDMLTRAEDSPLPREEMRAGATYQFTPRFSLGGSVSVGAEELDNMSEWEEQSVEAGVRLTSTFKF